MRGVLLSVLTYAPAGVVAAGVLGVDRLFEEFTQTFNKTYGSPTEREARRQIFADNAAAVGVLNAASRHARYDLMTPWADMNQVEFASMHGLEPETVCQFADPAPSLNPTAAPKPSLDYVVQGATVGPKDQGKCGSCWAHATTAVVEARLKLDTGRITSLSEQYLMDCDTARVCKGCCGGLPERAMQWLAGPRCPGIAAEASYPYASGSGTDPTEKTCNKTAPRVAQVTGFGTVRGYEADMMSANTQYGLLGVAMDSKPLQFYKSGVITINGSTPCGEMSNHAVAIVGYGVDSGISYWKVRNSYGPGFGEGGYFRIERGAAGPNGEGAPCGMSGCVIAATGAKYI